MVEDGCGATLNGEFWYFGGYYWGEIRQVRSIHHNSGVISYDSLIVSKC